MHACGAIATKLAPFVALAFWPALRRALVERGRCCSPSASLQIVTDVTLSTKSSDWKKFAAGEGRGAVAPEP